MDANPAHFLSLRILRNSPLTRDCRLLKLESREVARQGKPGQFLFIRVSPNLDPLLPRPFSLCQIRPKENSVSVVYKVGGPGTSWLSRRKAGEKIPVLGPLGNPFSIPKKSKRIALIGGGTGVTPLICLGEEAKKQKKEIYFFLGLRDKHSLTVTDSMLAFVHKDRRHFTTHDGSLGWKGDVVNRLKNFLEGNSVDYIAGCGPKAMLETLQALVSASGIPTEAAVEQTMACGLGYCLGCTVLVRENGAVKPLLACKDGPVLPLAKLIIRDTP